MKACFACMVGALLVLRGSAHVNAEPIRDQVFLPTEHGSISGPNPAAQTFTVGIAGTLSAVSIPLFGTAPVLVDVRRTTSTGFPAPDNEPRRTLAHAVVVPPSGRFELVTTDVRAFHVAVRPGDMMAITLRSPGILNWLIALDDNATYERGGAFLEEPGPDWRPFPDVFRNFSQGDFLFATSVEPAAVTPEPAALTLIAIGALMVVRRRQRRSAR